MKFKICIEDFLFEQISVKNLETMVQNKKISQQDFDEIVKVTNKPIFMLWLGKMVEKKIIKGEDIYKYKTYLSIFNKFKSHFPIKDISQITTSHDLVEFIKIINELRDKQGGDESKNKNESSLVSVNDIKKLESVGIKYLGLVDGYQIFEIPKDANNETAYKAYRDILGRCSGRETGQAIDICTIANYSYYSQYLKTDSLFVAFNLGDPKSPYQFHYQSGQFMNKNDESLF